MQYNYYLQIDTPEDAELFDFVNNKLSTYRKKIDQPIRPTVFVYNLLNKNQKKIYDLLYSKELYECPVCYIPINYKNEIKTNCNHIYCKDCIEKINELEANCPCCRSEITYYNISFVESKIYTLIFIYIVNLYVTPYKKKNILFRYPLKIKF